MAEPEQTDPIAERAIAVSNELTREFEELRSFLRATSADQERVTQRLIAEMTERRRRTEADLERLGAGRAESRRRTEELRRRIERFDRGE